MKKNILISIWEWQNRFSVQTMSHIRVHQHSTWGTWPLPRRCWAHPERMSKAPHPDCRESLWLISICPITSAGGAARVVCPSIDTVGKLQTLANLCWFQLVLPKFHLDIYFLIRHLWAWYGMPLLWGLSYKTNYNKQKKKKVLCPSSASISKVTSDFERFPYDTHMSSRDLFKVS